MKDEKFSSKDLIKRIWLKKTVLFMTFNLWVRFKSIIDWLSIIATNHNFIQYFLTIFHGELSLNISSDSMNQSAISCFLPWWWISNEIVQFAWKCLYPIN